MHAPLLPRSAPWLAGCIGSFKSESSVLNGSPGRRREMRLVAVHSTGAVEWLLASPCLLFPRVRAESNGSGDRNHPRRQRGRCQARPSRSEAQTQTRCGRPFCAATAPVRCDGAADRGVGAASGVGGAGWKHGNRLTAIVETGRCLSENRERRDSGALGPPGRARTPPSKGESGARGKSCSPRDRKEATGCTLVGNRWSKTEIPAKTLVADIKRRASWKG